MKILQGIDIVKVSRLEGLHERSTKSQWARLFTPKERAYCEPRRRRYEHYAARFAAKEAFIKAIEAKVKDGFLFRDIEVLRRSSGKPFLKLTPKICKLYSLPKDTQVEISLSHEKEYAVAVVTLVVPTCQS